MQELINNLRWELTPDPQAETVKLKPREPRGCPGCRAASSQQPGVSWSSSPHLCP